MRNNCPYSGEALGFRRQDPRDGRYLGGVPGLVLQGPCDDVVAQVEDEEADDKQRAHTAPHDLPVPVQGASGHGLELAFKSDRRVGRESLDYPCSWRQAVQATEPSVHKKLLCWAPVVLGHDHGALSPGGGSRAQAATRGAKRLPTGEWTSGHAPGASLQVEASNADRRATTSSGGQRAW